MIEILQHKADESLMSSSFSKIEEVCININKELVIKDRERMKNMISTAVNSYDKKNIEAFIKYFDRILKFEEADEDFEICWNIKDNIPESYPVTFINEKAYNINTCNYIEVDSNERLVEVDLYDLADIIAFSYLSRDLGETHESIEKLLSNCGIIGYEDANLLLDYFRGNGDNPFELSKSFQIDETPYFSQETRKVVDYFHTKEFKTKNYREVVDYSCKYANSLIMSTIIKNSLHAGINIKPVMISATNITFIVCTTDEVNIKNEILEDISVRAFGRRFRIEPRIEIF